MRKLYTIIVALLLFVTSTIYAQDPNNHWQLGTADVNFTTNTPAVATVANNGQYGNASISDDFGNLLFYTDGIKVWNKNHVVMTNGNNIGYAGVMNIIIVPNVANPNQFYIFRSESYLTNNNIPDPVFYLYSIVEFSNSNPLGIVLSINSNPLSSYAENQYSKALFDSSGVVSNTFEFGPLTSTKNSNDTGFWVVMQSKNKLLSYKIDSLGLNTTPVESTFTNAQIYDLGTYDTSYSRVNGIEGAKFRIAPNNSFLIGLEYSRTTSSPYDPDTSFFNFKNPFYKTNFNATTGIFSSYETFSGGIMVYEFEISKEANNLFFVRQKYPNGAPTYISDVVDGEVCVKDLNNNTNPIRVLNDFGTTTPSSKCSFLQRDKYGSILISSKSSTLNRNMYLHKIDNQDSFSTSSVNLNNISLNGYAIPSGNFYLPQLIPQLTPPCINNVVVTVNIPSGTDKKQASNTIIASNIVSSGAKGIYHAGNSVTFSNGFNAKSGSVFRAYIAGCTNTFVAKRKNPTKTEIISDKIKISAVKLYPSPNKGIFTIDLGFENKSEISVDIFDIQGKSVYKSGATASKFEVNVPNLPSGLYLIKLKGIDYEETIKFVKN